MNIERFIAGRILFDRDKQSRFSRPIVRIAVAGIAVGMTVMILTMAIMHGFQSSIEDKVIGFGSHIQIVKYTTNNSYEPSPMDRRQNFLPTLKQLPGVRHVQPFVSKPGILKSKNGIMGVVLKGVDNTYDWSFFKKNLVKGHVLTYPDTASPEVLISKYTADRLKLDTGKKFRMYFVRDGRPAAAKFEVAGIFDTGLEGFDDLFIFGDMREAQRVSGWGKDTIAGYEILVNELSLITPSPPTEEDTSTVVDSLGFAKAAAPPTDPAKMTLIDQIDALIGMENRAMTIRDLYPAMFSWLDVIDVNAYIIIALMIFVAVINMISALIVLILERTNMIGILKALGSRNRSVQKIFLWNALYLVGTGLLLGNILGYVLCWLQSNYGLLKLDKETYYIDTVPIRIEWWHAPALTLGTLIVSFLVLQLPAFIISRITPVKAIRFS